MDIFILGWIEASTKYTIVIDEISGKGLAWNCWVAAQREGQQGPRILVVGVPSESHTSSRGVNILHLTHNPANPLINTTHPSFRH